MNKKFGVVLHGGAGNMQNRNLNPEKELAYKTTMSEALKLGFELVSRGGNAIDIVEAVIIELENSPIFNAGKGSVFTHEGTNEMDAAIMDGATLNAGAVTMVKTIKNPISAAKAVLKFSKFVLLGGNGAEVFAKKQNLEIVEPSYFFEQHRWDEYLRVKESKELKLDHDADTTNDKINKLGTVGCVVLDQNGNLAAGTSTGGIVNKRYNRIGDSPIIGAGTYANNSTCAISCTGHGEEFIKLSVAHDVSALIEYKQLSIKAAAEEVILNKLSKIKGRGGLIGIDQNGNITMTFNTEGMFRGFVNESGEIKVGIYRDDIND